MDGGNPEIRAKCELVWGRWYNESRTIYSLVKKNSKDHDSTPIKSDSSAAPSDKNSLDSNVALVLRSEASEGISHWNSATTTNDQLGMENDMTKAINFVLAGARRTALWLQQFGWSGMVFAKLVAHFMLHDYLLWHLWWNGITSSQWIHGREEPLHQHGQKKRSVWTVRVSSDSWHFQSKQRFHDKQSVGATNQLSKWTKKCQNKWQKQVFSSQGCNTHIWKKTTNIWKKIVHN